MVRRMAEFRGVAVSGRLPSTLSSSRRRGVATGLACAVVACALFGLSGRVSLPSLLEWGWQSVMPGNAPADTPTPLRSHVDASTRGGPGRVAPTPPRGRTQGATRTTTTRPTHFSGGPRADGRDVPASAGVDGGTAPAEPPAAGPSEPPLTPGGGEAPGAPTAPTPTAPTPTGGSSSPSVPVIPTGSSVGVGIDAGDSGSVAVTVSVPSAASEPSPPSVTASTTVEVPAAPAPVPPSPPAVVPVAGVVPTP
jgi:hypothetical protein